MAVYKRAMQAAPDAPEAHLAAAIFASHRGDYRGAARALARALELAPTYADAQYYLGRLQLETGHASEGMGRLNLAAELDPSLSIGMVEVARHHFLAGRPAECNAVLDRLELVGERRDIPVLQLRMRIAAWTGDEPALRDALRALRAMQTPYIAVMAYYGAVLLGELSADELEARAGDLLARIDNARSAAFAAQLACEALTLLGRTASAMKHLRFACEGALTDLEWLDHCPALAPLRSDPELPALRDLVRARAAAIWSL